ncbi:hypothetical protein [Streptomyces sp. VB1]|nr:hypothetical protein [Streptomyces sp. VB1]UZI32809.1 hypothetical protein OH133_34585 [Streptomyces sp. VB1]
MKSGAIASDSSQLTSPAAQTEHARAPHRIPRPAKVLAGDFSGEDRG